MVTLALGAMPTLTPELELELLPEEVLPVEEELPVDLLPLPVPFEVELEAAPI